MISPFSEFHFTLLLLLSFTSWTNGNRDGRSRFYGASKLMDLLKVENEFYKCIRKLEIHIGGVFPLLSSLLRRVSDVGLERSYYNVYFSQFSDYQLIII